MRLSIGPGRSARAVTVTACALVVAAAGLLFVASLTRPPGEAGPILADGGADNGLGPTVGVADPDQVELLAAGLADTVRLLGLCAFPVLAAAVYLLVRALRRAAWLDGRRLAVRGAVQTSVADLGRAEVSLVERPGGRPCLVAREPDAVRPVSVPLAGLPPYQIDAIADAVTSVAVATRMRDHTGCTSDL